MRLQIGALMERFKKQIMAKMAAAQQNVIVIHPVGTIMDPSSVFRGNGIFFITETRAGIGAQGA